MMTLRNVTMTRWYHFSLLRLKHQRPHQRRAVPHQHVTFSRNKTRGPLDVNYGGTTTVEVIDLTEDICSSASSDGVEDYIHPMICVETKKGLHLDHLAGENGVGS